MNWDDVKRYLEERGHYLSQDEFYWLCLATSAKVVKNIDYVDYNLISIVTIDGIGWNFKVKKQL